MKASGGGGLWGAAGGLAGLVAVEETGGRFSFAPALHAMRQAVRLARASWRYKEEGMEPSFPCAAWNSAQSTQGLGALLDRQAAEAGI